MAKSDSFDKSIQLRIDNALLDEIDQWLQVRGFDWSRSEAIRALIKMGLQSKTAPGENVQEHLQGMMALSRKANTSLQAATDPRSAIEATIEQLKSIDELDNKLRLFMEDRAMLRAKLSEVRTVMLTALDQSILADRAQSSFETGSK